MNQIKRFKVPILVGVGTVVVFLIVFATWISPHESKASQLDSQKVTLQAQDNHLQDEINTLRQEKQRIPTECAQLNGDAAQIPTRLAADVFTTDLSHLLSASGAVISNLGLSAATGTGAGATSGVTPTQITFTIAGTYGQMMSFLLGLDDPAAMPRLFTISHIAVAGGPVAVGGSPIAAGAGGYSVDITGDIYNTNPGGTNVCTTTTTQA